MTDTVDHPTTPTATADPPPRTRHAPSGLYRVLAWVGIIAGVLFIVSVVFFSGFFLGKHSGGGFGHPGHHLGRGMHFFHRGGPMGPWPGQGGQPGNQVGPGVPPGPPPPPPTVPAPQPPRP